jgi:hypothetical protein
MKMPRIRLWMLMAVVAIVAGLFGWERRQNRAIDSPDFLFVEARSALPGRPITGTRLVRTDGMITLGYYGDVAVAGLSPEEAKAKIVIHLRRYLSDDALGLVESVTGTDGKRSVRRLSPYQTECICVRIDTKNSPNLPEGPAGGGVAVDPLFGTTCDPFVDGPAGA